MNANTAEIHRACVEIKNFKVWKKFWKKCRTLLRRT